MSINFDIVVQRRNLFIELDFGPYRFVVDFTLYEDQMEFKRSPCKVIRLSLCLTKYHVMKTYLLLKYHAIKTY